MELTTTFTYTELKAKLAEVLGRGTIPSSTLSRWMGLLDYPRGTPGRRRLWNGEDLVFIGSYGQAVSWGYTHEEAHDYAANQLEKLRSRTHARI